VEASMSAASVPIVLTNSMMISPCVTITGRVSEVLDAAELKKVPAGLPDEIEAGDDDVRQALSALR
jgi:hypothetical protein